MESIETRYQALEQQVLQRNPNADVARLRTATARLTRQLRDHMGGRRQK